MKETEIIKKIMPFLKEKICLFLNIETSRFEEVIQNFTIELKFSGHNNEISIVNFYSSQKILLGTACIKYTSEAGNMDKLEMENVVMNILKSNNIECPRIIDIALNTNGTSFILMEIVDDVLASENMLDIETAKFVLDTILAHESVLSNNLETLQLADKNLVLNQVIDFETKLRNYLRDYMPHFKIKDSCDFLNDYLNNFNIVKRSIITDRSSDNIFIGENNKITIIDFSTIRIGTQFDNWVQFIDDPRVRFSCSREELIRLFFSKNSLTENHMNLWYVSSIYTNLLQGIFTNKKNPELSRQYINNANDAFRKFSKKKGVLIDIGH